MKIIIKNNKIITTNNGSKALSYNNINDGIVQIENDAVTLNNSLICLGLPPSYQEVTYIGTTGQQTSQSVSTNAAFIDTLVHPKPGIKIETKQQFTSYSTSLEALNGCTATNARFAWGFANTGDKTKFYIGYGANNIVTSVARNENIHIFTIDGKNLEYSIDDVSGSLSGITFEESSTVTIFLFGRDNGNLSEGEVNKPCNANIYYSKIWDNDILIRDLVPCYRKSDNEIGMYDMVNSTFYTNSGAGTFLKGGDVDVGN